MGSNPRFRETPSRPLVSVGGYPPALPTPVTPESPSRAAPLLPWGRAVPARVFGVDESASIRDVTKGYAMNKLVKGSVAAATGIVLLMGGAGSLALWNDSQVVNGGTVSTGELDIALQGTGTWK